MTTPAVPSAAAGSDGGSEKPATVVLGPLEKITAVVLIALFVIFIAVLVLLRASDQWDRLVYLFGGLEALVFAAAGALFGTGVQRAQTQQAQDAANRERQRADGNENEALHGRALAAMIRAKRDNSDPEEREGRAARPGPGAPGGPSFQASAGALAELGQVVDEWFPPSSP